MKKLFPALLLFASFQVSNAQSLVSLSFLHSYTIPQIDSFYTANGVPGGALSNTYAVDVYKMIYNTIGADSLPTIASGAFFIPQAPLCHAPLASYQHGTILKKDDVPSRLSGEIIIGLSMAADGYVACMPDYIGMGDGPGFHPYVYSFSEGHAVADMIVAAIHACDSLNIQRSGQVFLVGYSEGGHATMAAHQMIQEQYGNYFTVTASTPMSGPYDLGGVQADVISAENPYPDPGYFPYVLYAYNSVYHWYTDIAQVFVPPYNTILPPLFDGTHTLGEVNAVMPSIPNDIIEQTVLDSFNTIPDFRMRVALRENETYHWIPDVPMRTYYCEGDNDVSYMNAIVAYDSMTAHGATTISKMSTSATADHVACALPSLLAGKYFFDSLRIDKLHLDFEFVLESYLGASDGAITVHVTSGYPPYTYLWSNGGTDSTISNLPNGVYTVQVWDATGCPASQYVHLAYTGIEDLFAQHVELFPNPFTDEMKIDFESEGNYSITLLDVSGRKIFSDHFFGTKYFLKRNNLPEGIYMLELQKDESIPFVKMIAVQ